MYQMNGLKFFTGKIKYQIVNTNFIRKNSVNNSSTGNLHRMLVPSIINPSHSPINRLCFEGLAEHSTHWTNREKKKEPSLFDKIGPSLFNKNGQDHGAYQALPKPRGEAGLKKYMTDVYIKSGGGFLTTLVVGSSLPFVVPYMSSSFIIPVYIGNFIFGFYSIYKMSSISISTIQNEDGLYEEENKNKNNKNNWYKAFSVSNGITIGPLCAMAFGISPSIVPIAAASTLGVFGAASAYALSHPDVKLTKYQAPLIGCVGGLIASGLIQITGSLLGYTDFAHSLNLLSTGVSTLIFTGLIAVDTQKAIEDYDNKQLDSVKIATELLLDAVNLFIDFVKILIELTKNKD
jgi:FtsH-binding integral membrane protein